MFQLKEENPISFTALKWQMSGVPKYFKISPEKVIET